MKVSIRASAVLFGLVGASGVIEAVVLGFQGRIATSFTAAIAASLALATYGALNSVDAIVHEALDRAKAAELDVRDLMSLQVDLQQQIGDASRLLAMYEREALRPDSSDEPDR